MHGDVVAAARVLYARAEAERGETMERLLVQAKRADRYRREMGKPHPFWGDGSLMSAALLYDPPAEPKLADEEYCACLAMVFETLINRERTGRSAAA
jgi:hypothetical protein